MLNLFTRRGGGGGSEVEFTLQNKLHFAALPPVVNELSEVALPATVEMSGGMVQLGGSFDTLAKIVYQLFFKQVEERSY